MISEWKTLTFSLSLDREDRNGSLAPCNQHEGVRWHGFSPSVITRPGHLEPVPARRRTILSYKFPHLVFSYSLFLSSSPHHLSQSSPCSTSLASEGHTHFFLRISLSQYRRTSLPRWNENLENFLVHYPSPSSTREKFKNLICTSPVLPRIKENQEYVKQFINAREKFRK